MDEHLVRRRWRPPLIKRSNTLRRAAAALMLVLASCAAEAPAVPIEDVTSGERWIGEAHPAAGGLVGAARQRCVPVFRASALYAPRGSTADAAIPWWFPGAGPAHVEGSATRAWGRSAGGDRVVVAEIRGERLLVLAGWIDLGRCPSPHHPAALNALEEAVAGASFVLADRDRQALGSAGRLTQRVTSRSARVRWRHAASPATSTRKRG
jgi:hypothetical protein